MLYAEDLTPGRVFELGHHTMSEPEIKAFAQAWDPLPFHIDDEAAAASPFGGIIASGLHTQAVAVRLVADAIIQESAIVAGRELRSMRLTRPVRPGTTLTGRVTVLAQKLRDDGRGVVVYRTELFDDDDELVLSMELDVLFARRP